MYPIYEVPGGVAEVRVIMTAMPKAILLISHGSRSGEARREVERLARRIKSLTRVPAVSCAFLEIETPSIPQAIGRCVRRGATEIVLLLHFLNSGRHIRQDIPRILARARRRFPKARFRSVPFIGAHSRIPDLYADLVRRAAWKK